jgi:hypothetical protein
MWSYSYSIGENVDLAIQCIARKSSQDQGERFVLQAQHEILQKDNLLYAWGGKKIYVVVMMRF